MTHPNESPPEVSPSRWQVLGERELAAGIEAGPALDEWLSTILRPLDLHADFLHRVQTSAHEASARAMQAPDQGRSAPIHLRVFVPAGLAGDCPCWGFFRIEKAGSAEDAPHAIEFYLYLEGK